MKIQGMWKWLCGTLLLAGTTACDKNERSFSILSESNTFLQSQAYAPKAVDILWIIDNSGSMTNSQTNLTNSFSSFIHNFQSKNYDFRMGVTATDAWLAKYTGDNTYRRLRDGADGNHSGVFVMDKNTPNLSSVFVVNATQGVWGIGDERALESMQDVLVYPGNSDFRRQGAVLAVIIVSDEDDFSNSTGSSIGHNYNHPNITPLSTYKTFLDNYAGVGNYNVSAISILDQACLTQLADSSQIIANRVMQFADMTGGVKVSLCSNFGQNLELISNQILSLAASFQLNREPIPSSIVARVNGSLVPQSSTNGWSYSATPTTWTVSFHGSAIPAAGATVQIDFDPVAAKN